MYVIVEFMFWGSYLWCWAIYVRNFASKSVDLLVDKIYVHRLAQDRDHSSQKETKCGVLGSDATDVDLNELKAEVVFIFLVNYLI